MKWNQRWIFCGVLALVSVVGTQALGLEEIKGSKQKQPIFIKSDDWKSILKIQALEIFLPPGARYAGRQIGFPAAMYGWASNIKGPESKLDVVMAGEAESRWVPLSRHTQQQVSGLLKGGGEIGELRDPTGRIFLFNPVSAEVFFKAPDDRIEAVTHLGKEKTVVAKISNLKMGGKTFVTGISSENGQKLWEFSMDLASADHLTWLNDSTILGTVSGRKGASCVIFDIKKQQVVRDEEDGVDFWVRDGKVFKEEPLGELIEKTAETVIYEVGR